MPERMSSAKLALIQRKLNANKPKRVQAQANTREDKIAGSVSGGFRAGKRKRGTSLQKRKPNTNAHAITFYVKNADGETVASVRTLSYKRK
jgi:hypothetical protein